VTYTQISRQAADPNWIERVKVALAQTALTKIAAAPVGAQAIAEDALGRFVRASLGQAAQEKSLDVALSFIGGADLEPGTVSDAAIFSAVNALWSDWLPAPAA
jgi:hypothetical protein